jgi:hypothetical protein
MWLVAVGVIALFFTGGQLLAWQDPEWAVAPLATCVTGGALVWWAQRRLRELDAANRPYLLGEGGQAVMRNRAETESRMLTASRWLLALFLVLGIAFFFLLSAASCGDRVTGYCGDVGRPSDSVMTAAQIVAVSAGAAWIAAVSLRRTHEKESERLDRVVAEGQRARRHDHPLSGMNSRDWD